MEHTDINIITLIRQLKKSPWKYAISALIGVTIGCYVAFNTPKLYVSEVVLSPEIGEDRSETAIKGISALLGKKNYGLYKDAIYPEVYPDVVKSDSFVTQLLQVPVKLSQGGERISFQKYLETKVNTSWWGKFCAWLQQATINDAVRSSVVGSVDKVNGLVKITVTTQDMLVSASMADSARVRLQDIITSYRLSKLSRDAEYLKSLSVEAKQDYQKSKAAYVEFVDQNQEVETQSVLSQIDKLEQKMAMNYDLYVYLEEELVEATTMLKREEPVFIKVQSAVADANSINKSKVVTIAAFMFLAVFVHLVMIIILHRKRIFHTTL